MPQLRFNSAGVRRRAFTALSSRIADRRSCAAGPVFWTALSGTSVATTTWMSTSPAMETNYFSRLVRVIG